ncbi:phosphatase PAP2 family protein [Bifidobacterium sp. MA2]|uniref:Phosphatase PAP2 family protein n=1 Tax=Bifidobacterium santillanense TaxID=2809028 RepID=A0ABS5US39_9BIFI|nr:phosphatase PAP2 family protein [Bifidobacterium santillanense]MBT1173740.1 phosphatase PAP2 family protein [Bifidobacterium santillanense]
MTDEQKPSNPAIRDPHAPSNLVRDFEPLDIPVPPVPTRPSSLSDVADVEHTDTMDLTAAMAAATTPSSVRPAGYPSSRGGSRAARRSRAARAAAAGVSSLTDEDPLADRPRISSRVLCVVFGLLLIAAAFGVWWLGVHTEAGQSFDDMAEVSFPGAVPGWLGGLLALGTHLVVVIGSALLAVAAAAVVAVRRRWWLAGQLVAFGVLCFASTLLKPLLPRPFIIHTEIVDGSSAPSGHVTLAVACSIALLLAVSRGWRWVAALVGMAWSAFVGLSVIYGQWHRPSDAAMATLLVGGIALIVLAFTRTSGMDATGSRRSSAGVQIVSSVSLTASVMAVLYGAYVVWQIVPGLTMSAKWAQTSSVAASSILVVAAVVLVFGLTLMMRQITAAPLTRLGLVGAPPAPPKRRRTPSDHAS